MQRRRLAAPVRPVLDGARRGCRFAHRRQPAVERGFADYIADYQAQGERCELAWGPLFASWGATTSCATWKRFARRSTSPCSTSWAPLTARASDPGGEGIFQLLGGGGGGGDGGDVAFNSVSCSDDTFEPPTLAELESLKAEFEAVSPLFAQGYLEGAATCAGWPATPDPVASPIALDAPPLLVIGGIMDARTPYEWSVAMTEALGNATLLTSNHYGHVAFGQGSDCVRLAIRAYLASGSLPATGATCPPLRHAERPSNEPPGSGRPRGLSGAPAFRRGWG